MEPALVAISRTTRWHELIHEKKGNINPIFLSEVPFSLLGTIEELVEANWPQISVSALSMTSQLTEKIIENPKKWMKYVTKNPNFFKIEHILILFKSAVIRDTIKTFLLDQTSPQKLHGLHLLEQKRHEANRSKEKGLMKWISEITLRDLAIRLGKYENWKLIADGLGLDNKTCLSIRLDLDNETCLSLHIAYSMFEKWMEKEKNATRARLILEVEQAGGMDAICNFIEGIAVEGTPRVPLIGPSPSEILSGQVTRFHIEYLDKLIEQNRSTIAIPHHIWQQGDTTFDRLLKLIVKESPQLVKIIEKVYRDIEVGDFNITSKGGVTLSQIHYLSKASLKRDLPPFNFIAKNHFYPRNFENWPGLMSFPRFLYLFWQFNDSEEADVLEMGRDVLRILLQNRAVFNVNVNNDAFIDDFERRVKDILPICEYSPELAAENLKKRQHQAVKQVEKIKQPIFEKMEVDQSLCVICLDKVRKYAIVPCGHYAFCLECISSLNHCPTCRSPIQHKLEIFHV